MQLFIILPGRRIENAYVSSKPYRSMATMPYQCYPSGMVSSFEWDPAKEAENRRKHGVSFREAQLAFLDPKRVIARDVAHSQVEPRFYCFGRLGKGVLSVRFTYRDRVIRIIGAGYWRKGKKVYETQRKLHR